MPSPIIPANQRLHGPHVPAARPQFREERLLPDRRTNARKSPQCTDAQRDGPMCILDPAPAKAWRSPKPPMPSGASRQGVRGRVRRRAGTPCPRPGRSLPARGPDGHDGLPKRSFGLLWLNPPYGDLSKDVSGSIGYQGQGRARLENCSISVRAVAVAVRRRAGLHRSRLRARRGAGRLADTPLHGPADLPSGGTAVQAGGDLRPPGATAQNRLPMASKPCAICCCRLGLAKSKPRSCRAMAVHCRTSSPPVRPSRAFLPRDDGPEQFADEVGRLQSLWPSLDTHLGPRSESLRPPARALSHWHLALALAAGAISGLCAPRPGACSSSKVTPTGQDAPAGIHRTRRRLHRRDPHPHRQVCSRHPRMGR